MKITTRNLSLLNKHIYWLLAVIITLSVFYPTINNGWVNWDDGGYVLENELIKTLNVEGIISIFKAPNVVGNYHPITVLSLAIDYAISSTNPITYHLHNLLLHLLNVVLAFLFISTLFRNTQVAFVVALLFGIHPMHVEAVAWVSARKDLLYTAYLLLGLLSYLQYSDCPSTSKKRGWYVLSFLLFGCSLLSKGVAIVFPAYLFLIDYFKGKKLSLFYFIEKLPFVILSVCFTAISFYSQNLEGAFITEVEFPFINRMAIASTSFLTYLFESLLPINLSPFHPYPFQKLINFPNYFYFSLLAIPGLCLFCWYAYRKNWKVIIFGILFFTLTLIPVLQLIPLGRAMMAERYTYVAYLGLFTLFGLALIRFTNQNPLKQKIGFGVFAILVLLFSSMSFSYSKSWKNGETLWSAVIDHYPKDYFGFHSRADYYSKQKELAQAMLDVNQSISLHPYFGVAYHLRGRLFEKQNDLQKAVNDYENAISLTPNYSPSYFSLARILGADQQPKAALKYLNQVLELNSKHPTAYLNRGVIYEQLKENEKAKSDYSNAIRLEPENGLYYRYRGVHYLANNEVDLSILDLTQSIRFMPKDGLSYFLRAKALQQKGLKSDALIDAEKAITLNYRVEKSFLNELKK